MNTKKPSSVVQDHFARLEESLAAEFSMLQQLVSHPGETGRLVEEGFKKAIEDHIPEMFGVATGFIVDSSGGVSKQIDLIVYHKAHTPFIFRGVVSLIPVECVILAIEIKSRIDSGAVKDAHEKALSVYSLKRSAFVPQSTRFQGRLFDKTGNSIIQFLLAGLSSVGGKTLLESYKKCNVKIDEENMLSLQSIISLRDYSALPFFSEDGRLSLQTQRLANPAIALMSSINFAIAQYRGSPVDFQKYAPVRIEKDQREK